MIVTSKAVVNGASTVFVTVPVTTTFVLVPVPTASTAEMVPAVVNDVAAALVMLALKLNPVIPAPLGRFHNCVAVKFRARKHWHRRSSTFVASLVTAVASAVNCVSRTEPADDDAASTNVGV